MTRTGRLCSFVLVAVALISTTQVLAQDRDDRDRDRRSGVCFYKDADFRGAHFCMEAGDRMARVPQGFNDQISSLRIFGHTDITVFENTDFGGRILRLHGDVADLKSYEVSPGHTWNDRISSIEVSADRDSQDRYHDHDRDRDRNNDDQGRRGGACFYKDADFHGEKFCVERGERLARLPEGFNDTISSIRIFGDTEITVYQDRDFGGVSLDLHNDVTNLRDYQISPGHSWNDRVSSIRVR
jgi:Peptidase inhibitor family I36